MLSMMGKIYDKLQDEISRDMYLNRCAYNISGDFKFIRKIFDCIEITRSFIEAINDKKELAIFGAGRYGEIILKAFPEFPWQAFIDNDLNKCGKKYLGLPVFALGDFKIKHPKTYIVVPSRVYWNEIKLQLLKENIENQCFLLGELLDELMARQYFDCPGFTPESDEVFVDAGVLDGYSSLGFIKWSGNCYKKIYLFEPNATVQESIREKLTGEDYELIHKGLWDNNKTLYFVENKYNTGGSYVTEEPIAGSVAMPVTAMDNLLVDVPVSFIKMDIEGSELKALHGAERIIKRYAPKMAISMYHKPNDVIEIPEFIMKCNHDYKFWIRHYAYTENETVLYAAL